MIHDSWFCDFAFHHSPTCARSVQPIYLSLLFADTWYTHAIQPHAAITVFALTVCERENEINDLTSALCATSTLLPHQKTAGIDFLPTGERGEREERERGETFRGAADSI